MNGVRLPASICRIVTSPSVDFAKPENGNHVHLSALQHQRATPLVKDVSLFKAGFGDCDMHSKTVVLGMKWD